MFSISYKNFMKEMVEKGWDPDQLDLQIGIESTGENSVDITAVLHSTNMIEKVRIEYVMNEWMHDSFKLIHITNMIERNGDQVFVRYKGTDIFWWEKRTGWSSGNDGLPMTKFPQNVGDHFRKCIT